MSDFTTYPHGQEVAFVVAGRVSRSGVSQFGSIRESDLKSLRAWRADMVMEHTLITVTDKTCFQRHQ